MKLHSAAFCFLLGIAQIALSQAGTVLSPGLSEAERQVQMAERQVDMRPREQRTVGTSMVEMQREAKELRRFIGHNSPGREHDFQGPAAERPDEPA